MGYSWRFQGLYEEHHRISWDMNWQPFDLWMSELGDLTPGYGYGEIPSEPSNHHRESTMILMAQKTLCHNILFLNTWFKHMFFWNPKSVFHPH
jgi:hypothetical protein